MTGQFDLTKIDVKHFLDSLDIEYEQATGSELKFHCPFPGHTHEDRNASAYINSRSTAWFCHGCHAKGNAIHFAAKLLEITQSEAARMLREKYDPGYFDPDSKVTEDEVRRILSSKPIEAGEIQPVLPESAIDRFRVDWVDDWSPVHSYAIGRGFTTDTLESWQLGYDEKTDRLTISVRDEHNNLIGFKGRALDESVKQKYLVLGDSEERSGEYGWRRYHTGRVVFGLPQAILAEDTHIEGSPRHFVVCEGELNAIAIWQAGYAGIAINGSNLTEFQINTIIREADRLTLFFDQDEGGERATNAAIEAFSPYMVVRVIKDRHNDPAKLLEEDREDRISELICNSAGATEHVISSQN